MMFSGVPNLVQHALAAINRIVDAARGFDLRVGMPTAAAHGRCRLQIGWCRNCWRRDSGMQTLPWIAEFSSRLYATSDASLPQTGHRSMAKYTRFCVRQRRATDRTRCRRCVGVFQLASMTQQMPKNLGSRLFPLDDLIYAPRKEKRRILSVIRA